MRLIGVLAAALAGSILASVADGASYASASGGMVLERNHPHEAGRIDLAQRYDDDPFYDRYDDEREDWNRREDRARERAERRREEDVRRSEQRRNRQLDQRNRELDQRNRELDRRNRETARRQRERQGDDFDGDRFHRRRIQTYQLGNTPFRVDGQGRLAPDNR